MSSPLSISCWCGLGNLAPFSEFYRRCTHCNTLVSVVRKDAEYYKGSDNEEDLYGKQYWTEHVKKLGFPDIFERSKADLTERSLYWLKSILEYRLPPAKTLELGCAHGGSVYLQRMAGYDATGAEMSPWLCQYATSTFDVPMLCGDIESIDIPRASFDIVILMDVLEHFVDPLRSLNHIVDVLAEDGLVVIQTPAFRSVEKSYEQMKSEGEMFVLHMKEDEHLYLFNEESVRQLFDRVGLHHIAFEPPIFGYDMFIFASKHPLFKNTPKTIEAWLTSDPSKRVILAMIDLYNMLQEKTQKLKMQIESNDELNRTNIDVVLENERINREKEQERHNVSVELMLIKNSLTWKITKPIRLCCDKILQLLR